MEIPADVKRLIDLERMVHEYEQQISYFSAQIRSAEELIGQKDVMIKDCEQRCSQMAYELAELKEQLLEKDESVTELEVSNTKTGNIHSSNLSVKLKNLSLNLMF